MSTIKGDSSYPSLPYVNQEHDLLVLIREDPTLFGSLQREVGRIGRFLKSGANGSVYEVQDASRVLKLTRDEDEAKSANILLHNPMAEAVTVYGVWELPEMTDDYDEPVECWAILMERLEPLEVNDKAFIRKFQSFMPRGGVTEERVDAFIAAMKGKFKPHLFAWLKSAVGNLEARKIVNRDMHAGNVMRRKDGQLVIIDMGGGSDAPDSDIKKLAAMFEALAARIAAWVNT